MAYNCICKKSFKSFEDFAKHHNQTGHMETEVNHKETVTWFDSLKYWWIETIVSEEMAFVCFVFIVLVIAAFLMAGVL